jgi:hypothetical protein
MLIDGSATALVSTRSAATGRSAVVAARAMPTTTTAQQATATTATDVLTIRPRLM